MEINEELVGKWLRSKSPVEVIKDIYDKHLQSWENFFRSFGKSGQNSQLLWLIVKLLEKFAVDIRHHSSSNGDAKGRSEDAVKEDTGKQIRLLTVACTKEFAQVITIKLSAMSFGILSNKSTLGNITKANHSSCDMPQILTSLAVFCKAILEKLPYMGKDALSSLICACVGVTQTHQGCGHLAEEFLILRAKTEELIKEFEEKVQVKSYGFTEDFERLLHSKEPPDDFRKLTIVPTMYELLHDKHPFLRPNKIKGPYNDGEHYYDVQFRLLKEDFVQPLRKGVEEFMQNREEYIRTKGRRKTDQQNISVRLYFGVRFNRTVEDKDHIKNHLFNLPREFFLKINWDKSKKLISGSLIMLTSDNCKTGIFATLLPPPFAPGQKEDKNQRKGDPRRSELSAGILRVLIESGEELLEYNKEYIVFECEAYFESIRHNLNILQITDLGMDNDIFNKYIVGASSSANIPAYFNVNNGIPARLSLPIKVKKKIPPRTFIGPLTRLQAISEDAMSRHVVDLSVAIPHSNPDTWPTKFIMKSMGLDENQYEAYKSALTSELSIIQGPPGTGKTFIGLQIVKTLLMNRFEGIPESPILVLCYTNHALDQFLELLLQAKVIQKEQIVRVGGQSKSTVLDECSLQTHRRNNFSARKNTDSYKRAKSAERNAFQRVENIESQLNCVKLLIDETQAPAGLLDFCKMGTWGGLCQLIPVPLQEAIASPDWLGFSDQMFTAEYFDVEEVMKRWFKVSTSIDDTYAEVNEVEVLSKDDVKNAETENQMVQPDDFEDNENYDMDELMEHRLTDDYYYDINDFDRKTKIKIENLFLSNYSVVDCYQKMKSAEFNTQRLEQCLESLLKAEPRRKLSKAEKKKFKNDFVLYEWQQFEYDNRQKLLGTIFGMYKRALLPLPNVTGIFVKEDDQDDGSYSYNLTQTLHSLSVSQRWGIYFEVVKIANGLLVEALPKLQNRLKEAYKHLATTRVLMDGCILQSSLIIGMTTTGAAKHHLLLETAKPQIVIVEEAAEILEAHVITSLTKDCKQLILIGDHLQLRPSTNVFQLGRKYHMNVSLFERMILNNVNLCTLKTQHRMRPDISDLIIGPIYNELYDHTSVFKYPHVKGVLKDLFFLSHTERESTDSELFSKTNAFEVDFIAGFCHYLLQQGYEPSQITILTTYTGQMFLLKKVVSPTCRGVRITCVDNYQGEENDIILLSTVRSNEEGKIGFVGIDNRICVALSRAKHGLYVVGNLTALTSKCETWQKIEKKLAAKNNHGSHLKLICDQHKKVTKVNKLKDFAPLRSGGCDQICKAELKCSHLCPKLCHAKDRDHSEHICIERCAKRCPNDHQCKVKCHLACPPCEIQMIKVLPCEYKHEITLNCHQNPAAVNCPIAVTKMLPCGHELDLPCHKNPAHVKCHEKVDRILDCELNHVKEMECYLDKSKVKCDVIVQKRLPCGHVDDMECHQSPDKIKCLENVEHTFKTCNHVRKLPCWQVASAKCVGKCYAELGCGHICKNTCHVDDDPLHLEYKCKENCIRSCIAGHQCSFKHACHMPCPNCSVKVDKTLKCEHVAKLACHKDPAEAKCVVNVEKTLLCGHIKTIKCYLPLEKAKCDELVDIVLEQCLHSELVLCWNKATAKCSHKCEGTLACGHKCNSKCHVVEDPDHKRDYFCKKMCEKSCQFGHPCSFKHKCVEKCPPCEKMVNKALPCNPTHFADYPCGYDESLYQCHEMTSKRLPCGHDKDVLCNESVDSIMCMDLFEKSCKYCNQKRNVVCFFADNVICTNEACDRRKAEQERSNLIKNKRMIIEAVKKPNAITRSASPARLVVKPKSQNSVPPPKFLDSFNVQPPVPAPAHRRPRGKNSAVFQLLDQFDEE